MHLSALQLVPVSVSFSLKFVSVCFVFRAVPSQSPSLPQVQASYHGSSSFSGTAGLLSFTHHAAAAKQKSAFAPVVRTGFSPPPSGMTSGVTSFTGGWAHPILNHY